MELGEVPPERQIVKDALSVAWPSVLESFFVNLAGVVDTIMVGSLGSYAIAAVGLTTQPKFLGLAVFISLNVAVSAIVARRKGAGDRESANRVVRMLLLFTLILTALISVVFVIFAGPIVSLVGSQPDTHEYAVEYLRIIMGGSVFSTVSLVLNAAQRGAGNTRIAMVTNVISNLVNVIFNYLLIGGNFGFPALGVRGAAIATVIGTVCACTLSIVSVLHKDGFIYLRAVKGWIADKLSIKSILNVGSSAFVEQICLRIGFLLFSMTVARLGTTQLAAHQIGMNMMSMSFSFGDGFSVAAVTLIGQSLGRKRPDMAKIYGNVCQKTGLICAFVISSFYFLFGKDIFALFSQEQIILDYGEMIMRILSVILFVQIEQVVLFGCLRGAGDTKFTAFVSLISVTCIRPGMSWLLCYPVGLGLMGAWLGTACDQVVRFVMTFVRFRKGNWTKLKL
ncbi:MATE family efflux transporter [Neglectibacter timonensis]|jgi:putative MATE family efflux protein|uniref:Probable multidrug resistance protein NorM n=1 Tax=Neglectibacter timonensis TaxID=1776382 RepID=A0ABT1RUZ5_9FIRM|nr:MATE family efflux transporter [Neglectibacter timonensis]MCQ4838497.1 MATE family efflux transporter [Neglectibacter timonensis]MCQ4841929.1 MATE family efflux transporter [Neglectibacter timonensis]MEE0729204.1 MATE family efflux transporter [Oscillospiraceae bacterium]